MTDLELRVSDNNSSRGRFSDAQGKRSGRDNRCCLSQPVPYTQQFTLLQHNMPYTGAYEE